MSRAFAGFMILFMLTPPVNAAEGDRPIRDGAGLFGADAIAQATDQILEMRQTTKFDFVLETTAKLPDDVMKRLDRASNVDAAFREYALERAEAEDIHGVYVFISTKPKYKSIAVIGRPEEVRDTFSGWQCEKLRKLLAGKLEKHPDEALLKTVDWLRERNKAESGAETSWFGWGTIAAILGGLLVLWLLLGLARMRTNHTPAPASGEANRPGFVPGLFGGMFGSMAGHWIYDTILHSPPNPAPPATPAPLDTTKPSKSV